MLSGDVMAEAASAKPCQEARNVPAPTYKYVTHGAKIQINPFVNDVNSEEREREAKGILPNPQKRARMQLHPYLLCNSFYYGNLTWYTSIPFSINDLNFCSIMAWVRVRVRYKGLKVYPINIL